MAIDIMSKTNEVATPCPWRVAFTCGKERPSYQEIQRDLLRACWGNEKMAAVLYHLLNAGSWKAFHTHLDPDSRSIILHESHKDILAKLNKPKGSEPLAKLNQKPKLSEPTLIFYLKLFLQVGYIRRPSYRKALEVDFAVIEQAFLNPPEKPILDENLSFGLSFKAKLKSEHESELKRLALEVARLTQMVADLSLTLVSFKFQNTHPEHESSSNLSLETKELKLKESDEGTPEANPEAENFLKNPSLEKILEESKKVRKDTFLPADPDLFSFFLLMDDSLETETPSRDIASSDYKQKPEKPKTKRGSSKKPPEKSPTAEVIQPGLALQLGSVALTEDQQRVFDYYCKLWFIERAPKITEKIKADCDQLAPYIQTMDDMIHLEQFARNYIKTRWKKDPKVLHLGNFTNTEVFNAWTAERKDAQAQQQTPEPAPVDPNRLVVWTRYDHPRSPMEYWYLYELMPDAEARLYGYEPEALISNELVPSDQLNIQTCLRGLQEGYKQLTREQLAEYERIVGKPYEPGINKEAA